MFIFLFTLLLLSPPHLIGCISLVLGGGGVAVVHSSPHTVRVLAANTRKDRLDFVEHRGKCRELLEKSEF